MDNNYGEQNLAGMSTTNYSFTPIQNSKSLQKRGIWMPVHQNLENGLKFLTNTFAILPFFHKNT